MDRGQKRDARVARICGYRFAACVLFVLFSLCGERRPLLGGSAVENPGGCGVLAALTDEEGNFLWLDARGKR